MDYLQLANYLNYTKSSQAANLGWGEATKPLTVNSPRPQIVKAMYRNPVVSSLMFVPRVTWCFFLSNNVKGVLEQSFQDRRRDLISIQEKKP